MILLRTAKSKIVVTKLKMGVYLCPYCNKECIKPVYPVQTGRIKSCGCVQRELQSISGKTHGRSGTPEYTAWIGIRERCYNTECSAYPNYGGRGIQMSPEWRDDLEQFLQDMGNRPGKEYSIERVDNNGWYEASNCRWANKIDQGRNTRRVRQIEYKGKIQNVYDWSKETGIPAKLLYDRILVYNWDIERAMTTPKLSKKEQSQKLKEWYTIHQSS